MSGNQGGHRRGQRRSRVTAAVTVLACAALVAAGGAVALGFAGGHGPGSRAAAAARAARQRPPASPRQRDTATASRAAASPATSGPAQAPGRPAGEQLITVTAPAYGDTYASLSAYQWAGSGWRRVLGPWQARIGRGGMAPPGAKREGDGRTPSGTFRLPFLFGTGPAGPGFRLPYRQSHPWIAWDDDPASPRYNEWVDTRYHDPGASPEPMDVSAYVYGVVIGYNQARTPGLGSAIFLHANIGIATAGCVTLPIPRLLRVLRWLDPRRSPRIRLAAGQAAGSAG